MPRPSKEVVDQICRGLVDQGNLLEAGWKSYELLVLPVDAPTIQRHECRIAFFAGAQHLFSSIMGILEPGDDEPTEKDLRRMDAINKELNRFIAEFKLEHLTPARGRG
jgi:hypothetical protein